MWNGLFKFGLAALIAFGIVGYVTDFDLSQVSQAIDKATQQSVERKRQKIAAANAAPEAPSANEDVVAVVTKRSVAKALAGNLEMSGATEANRRVDVRAEISGVVTIAPTKGMRVRRGELLCRLAVGDRAARRESAVARFRQAQVDAKAQQRLSDRGYAAANQASDAKTSAEVIRAEIKQLDIEIGHLEIRAPFDGIIEDDPAHIGVYLQPGNTCATLVDPDPLRVVGFASEYKVRQLRPGMSGSAHLATGESVKGTIVYIAQTADAATRTFQVDLAVRNPNYTLRDAVTADIAIPLGTQPAHELPQSALTLDNEGEIGVMVAENGIAKFKTVVILRQSADAVWVGGIGTTADIIVVGQEYVRDGAKITTTPQIGSILGEQS